MDMSHHFSRVTKKRNESNVKRFYKYFQIPGIGNLAGGQQLPTTVTYPFNSIINPNLQVYQTPIISLTIPSKPRLPFPTASSPPQITPWTLPPK